LKWEYVLPKPKGSEDHISQQDSEGGMTMLDEKEEIRKRLMIFVSAAASNSLIAHGGMPIYDAPLMAIAAADDPLFDKLKEPGVIGPDHLVPQDFLAGARSVISYFLPFTKEIRQSNQSPGLPSEEWVSARIDGETFNNEVRRHLVALVKELDGRGVAPALEPLFQVHEVASNWSERHVAYIAGLGTFGLHRHLITSKGCAGRLGSVVTSLELPPTARSYQKLYEYCLWYAEGTCGDCIERCPSKALALEGKDKYACRNYLFTETLPRFKPRYGCGKCQVGLPCEATNPTT
jgi:epoxyqueuosine reductase QueG